MEHRVFNFSPGPATLPLPVLEEAQRDLLSLPGLGMSALEISHRSDWFAGVMQETTANLRQLLQLPDDFSVLYVQGGSRLQFSMAPMNLLRGDDRSADYLVTGSWGAKAIKDASREGRVNVAFDNRSENYRRLPRPDEIQLSSEAAYVYFTSNETIQGVQFPKEPETSGVPLMCDASSDFLSRPLEMERYGILFACAQKNLGPAGVTIVLIRNQWLEQIPEGIHSMLDYREYAKSNSLVNTPPVFAVYVVQLVTRWLLNDVGGLGRMHERNQQQAALLYDVLDRFDEMYLGHAQPESRSLMNVTFRLPSDEVTAEFIKQAAERGLNGLKGHRSVGGIRASIYNAMPTEGVEKLRDFMVEFAERA